MTPEIRRIEDALRLILDWANRSDVVVPERGQTTEYPSGLPVVASVSDQLGPGFAGDGPAGHLLNVQDRIFRPDEVPTWSGVRVLVSENQGVWAYGFRPGDPLTLMVTGDWCDRPGTRYPEDWRAAEATTEDALVNAVLTNGLFALDAYCESELTDDYDRIPPETDVLLWQHAAWGQWPGIWTNAARTLLHFGGMGLTYRR